MYFRVVTLTFETPRFPYGDHTLRVEVTQTEGTPVTCGIYTSLSDWVLDFTGEYVEIGKVEAGTGTATYNFRAYTDKVDYAYATIRIGVGIFDPFDWRARFNVKAYLDDEFLGEKEVDMRTIIEAHVEFTKELAEKPIQPPAPQVPQEKPVPYPAAMIIPSLICGALFIITSSRA